MAYTPLSIARRHVLGDLYSRCDKVDEIPVYLGTETGLRLGFANEGLGHYADAISFHLPEDVCKKLSAGYFRYSFGYDYADPASPARPQRIKLNYICLLTLAPVVKAKLPEL